MNSWIKFAIAASAFVVTCFVMISCKQKKGETLHYVVEVSPDGSSVIPIKELCNQSMIVLKKRLTGSGLRCVIKQTASSQIDIMVEGVTDNLQTRQLIESRNKLEIRELYRISELSPSLERVFNIQKIDLPKDSVFSRFTNANNIFSLIAFNVDATGQAIENGVMGQSMVKDTALITKMLSDPKIRNCFPADIAFYYGFGDTVGKLINKRRCDLYAIKTKMMESPLTNKNIVFAERNYGADGKPALYFKFNDEGSRIWEEMTRQNKGRYLAIIIDKKVISAPHVESEITGGQCMIHGIFSEKEIDLLASQFTAGYLPAQLHVILQEIKGEKP